MQTQTSDVDSGKEFNQVEEHDHRLASGPCWCGFGVGTTGRADYSRPTAVVGRGQQALIKEYHTLLSDYKQVVEENIALKTRIFGFETMARSLSEFIDRREAEFTKATGQTLAEYLGLGEKDGDS